ncbi:MAG: hypothetical protein AABW73_04325 [Nanoarchaeota archaeon]
MEDNDFKKLSIKARTLDLTKKDFTGSSPPAVFIGSKLEYPAVNVGVLSAQFINTNPWVYNTPNFWTKKELSINKIIDLRKNLINSRIKTQVSAARQKEQTKIIRQIQEIGMAVSRADIEIKLEKKPSGKMIYDKENMPLGIGAKMNQIKILSNTKILPEVERVNSEKEMRSTEAIKYLYKKGLGEQSLTQLLSIGITGMKNKRKFVPTKNSITAIDDTIGKQILEEIKNKETIDKPEYYFGGHLGNYYIIIMIPEVFSYELFEMSIKEGKITGCSTDNENYNGRKEYAKNTAGGYYASRLAILEKLKLLKKQAGILALRIITEEYHTPLGVWVCRNSTRIALEKEGKEYETKEELIESIKKLAKEEFRVEIEPIINKSIILKEMNEQSKLKKYF